MRAVYEIYSCGSGKSDERVTIDVCDDPTYMENCVKAVKAAGYDPYDQCDCGGGPSVQGRFVEYAGPATEVPIELIKQLVKVVNLSQKVSLSRDSECVAVIGQALELLGYVDRDKYYQYSIVDELEELCR